VNQQILLSKAAISKDMYSNACLGWKAQRISGHVLEAAKSMRWFDAFQKMPLKRCNRYGPETQ